ncbi:MAG: DUF4783 domain-containing protein [Muribaculaceae bacterium]|nr:DUF4783 domain-containing protein [Muribaculaceae bacterium]
MMKKIIIILTFAIISSLPCIANDARMAVEEGFAKGNAQIVSEAMSDRIFMVAQPIRKPLAKDEATKELANFFMQNKPKSFSVLHDNSQDNVIYMICKLETDKTAYRVHVLIDVLGDEERISQIRIETL